MQDNILEEEKEEDQTAPIASRGFNTNVDYVDILGLFGAQFIIINTGFSMLKFNNEGIIVYRC